MNREALKKAYLTAAIAAGSLITALFFYAGVGEVLLKYMGHKPALQPPASSAVQYLV